MTYRATRSSVTGLSFFYLLQGRELPLPNSDNLKEKFSRETLVHHHRLQNLKASLNTANKCVNKRNRRALQNNKRLYIRRAKLRKFKIGDLIILYSPAMKHGLSRNLNKPWSGPHKITRVATRLNFEIVIQNNKKQIVRVSRLKQAYDSKAWKHKAERKTETKLRKKPKLRSEEEQKNENNFGSYPLSEASQPEFQTEHQVPPDQAPINPEAVRQITDTPTSEYHNPTF